MLSACGQIFNEAQSLHFRYGSSVALSTLSPIRYLLRPKTRFPVRRLHLLSGQEFHPLEAPGFSWRTVVQVDVGQERTNRLSLPRPLVTHEKLILVDDSNLNPLPYQAKHASIADAFLDHLHELLSHDRIEVCGDV